MILLSLLISLYYYLLVLSIGSCISRAEGLKDIKHNRTEFGLFNPTPEF